MKNLKGQVRDTPLRSLFQNDYRVETSIVGREVCFVILEQISNIAFNIEESVLNQRSMWLRTDGNNVRRIFHST